jgi:hypothetical protein
VKKFGLFGNLYHKIDALVQDSLIFIYKGKNIIFSRDCCLRAEIVGIVEQLK